MALDMKDPKDKAAVDALIAEALAEQTEEHETAITGLKAKQTELLGKLKKAKEGNPDNDSTDKLEAELDTTKTALKQAQKDLGKVTKERDTFKTTAEGESAAVKKMVADGGLTEALIGVNVAKQFLPAVKAMLLGKVTVEQEGEARIAKVDGKPLSEFVKTWSQSDDGKHYVAAPANGGGGAPGGPKTPAGGKTMLRSAFDALDAVGKSEAMKAGTQLTDS